MKRTAEWKGLSQKFQTAIIHSPNIKIKYVSDTVCVKQQTTSSCWSQDGIFQILYSPIPSPRQLPPTHKTSSLLFFTSKKFQKLPIFHTNPSHHYIQHLLGLRHYPTERGWLYIKSERTSGCNQPLRMQMTILFQGKQSGSFPSSLVSSSLEETSDWQRNLAKIIFNYEVLFQGFTNVPWPLFINKMVKEKWFRYRPGVAQRVGRGIALLFHERGTRRWWVVSSTPRLHFTPGKDPGTYFTGGWVGPRAGLDGRKISSPPGFDHGPSSP